MERQYLRSNRAYSMRPVAVLQPTCSRMDPQLLSPRLGCLEGGFQCHGLPQWWSALPPCSLALPEFQPIQSGSRVGRCWLLDLPNLPPSPSLEPRDLPSALLPLPQKVVSIPLLTVERGA